MAEVWFYHLERKSVDDELPGLLQRGLERGVRMAVITSSTERVKELSQKLWSVDDIAFLPHGFEGEPMPESQMIFLSGNGHVPNAAAYRFYVDGTAPDTLAELERASILFDGREESAVQQARDLWRRFKAENLPIRYWKQDDEGRWKDQAVQDTSIPPQG
jgi:DNA polymerase III subunit chi